MVSTDITTAGTLSTKATKALDTMRARIVKADAARTEAAHEARAVQSSLAVRSERSRAFTVPTVACSRRPSRRHRSDVKRRLAHFGNQFARARIIGEIKRDANWMMRTMSPMGMPPFSTGSPPP